MAADRHILKLTPSRQRLAHEWVDRAVERGRTDTKSWMMELKEPTRTDEQNNALHSLIDQIIKQRPLYNGIRMDKGLWRAAFMQALGEEVRFIPTLDGKSVFPIGLSTSKLSVPRFAELIEFVLSWMATEGLEIKYFDEEKAA